MKNAKIIGIVLGLLVFLATAAAGIALASNKYGKAVTPPFPQPAEKDLQKIIFIRYAPGKEPLSVCDYDGICEPRENWKSCPNDCPKEEPTPTPTLGPSACYGFLSGSKPKWNWVEEYTYSTNELGTTSVAAVDTWESVTSGEIFGAGTQGTYPWGVYDYHNALSYGDYPEKGVIAVTAIWFRAKNIYEYDIMFDIDYFPGTTDLDTVALHEFGHGAGLNDLYDGACSDEVMYGYYTGVKRDLHSGDITGIQTLYGN